MALRDGMKSDNYKIYIGLNLILVKDFNIESNIESNMLCFNLRLNFEHISLFGNPTNKDDIHRFSFQLIGNNNDSIMHKNFSSLNKYNNRNYIFNCHKNELESFLPKYIYLNGISM